MAPSTSRGQDEPVDDEPAAESVEDGDQEPRRPGSLSGPAGVTPQIEYWDERPSLFAVDPLSFLPKWKRRIEEKFHVALGFNGYLLYQNADRSNAVGDDQALGGIFRFQGSWTTFRNTSHPGRLAFRVEGRDALGSLPAPTEFGASLGIRALNTGFVYVENYVVDLAVLKWVQTFLDDRIEINAGILAFDVHQDFNPFQTIGRAFLNRAFVVNPTIGTTNIGALGAVATGFLTENFWVGAQFYDAAAENGRRFWNTVGEDGWLTNGEIGWTPSRDRYQTDRIQFTFWHKDESDRTGAPSGWGVTLSAAYQIWDPFLAFIRAGRNDGGGGTPARTAVSTGFEYAVAKSQAYALGFGWGSPPSGLRDEYVIETSYNIQVIPHLSILPDLQFVVNPAAASDDFLFLASLRTIVSF